MATTGYKVGWLKWPQVKFPLLVQRSKGIPLEAEVNDIFAGWGCKDSRRPSRDTCGQFFPPFFPGKKEWNENIVFDALIEATTHGCR